MQLSAVERNRYSRHLILDEIGEEGQLKLKTAKILVIGAGGLGCPVLQYLTAAGVGTIGIIDDDVVDETNLQRQILYTVDDIGKPKALAARERLQQLNPHTHFLAYQTQVNPQNALELIAEYDIIVDGSDNFATRYLVNDACVQANKPMVYGAIFKFEGQVAVFNYEGSASYRCLFERPPASGEMPSCSEVGVLGVLPGIIGTMQANEVLKIILGIGTILASKFWTYNALTCQTMCLEISSNQSIIDTTKQYQITEMNYEAWCNTGTARTRMTEITAQELKGKTADFTLVDVRELFEQPRYEDLEVINIPLPRLLAEVDKIPRDTPVVMICQKGIRSQIAIDILQKQHDYDNLINLKGGMSAWQKMLHNL